MFITSQPACSERLASYSRLRFIQQRPPPLQKGRVTVKSNTLLLLCRCSAVATGASGCAAASCLVCVCESWSHVLSPRPLFRCQFTWWAELLCIYLHCHMYGNWWGCLWPCCSKLWLFLSGLYNTIITGFTRCIKVCQCSLIGIKHLLHTLKHIPAWHCFRYFMRLRK